MAKAELQKWERFWCIITTSEHFSLGRVGVVKGQTENTLGFEGHRWTLLTYSSVWLVG